MLYSLHIFSIVQAWFRELPSGVLDSIPPEQVMQCQSEEDCARVAKCLPPTEAALLDWAVNLMADVVQEEQINKMNDRNVAMVFAPNMTQVTCFPDREIATIILVDANSCTHVNADGRSFDCTDVCSTSDEFPQDAYTENPQG